ncbi:hypothetical protein CGMCC3_g16787 [Colletotrichum fructicola]|nr:uncharacterized protein CGMCC3_g16787 [Colletotrichum fructicola]KAE9567082.1 hypothetical protein CGMCC3_g16787 [Colletotrichum fructicola]
MFAPPECDRHGKSVRVSVGNLDGLQDFVDLAFHAKFRYCQSLVGLVICAVGNRMPAQEVSPFRAIPNRRRPTTSSRPFQINLPQVLSGCHGISSTVPPIQASESVIFANDRGVSVDRFAEIGAQLQYGSVRNADASDDDSIDKTMVPGSLRSEPTRSKVNKAAMSILQKQ